MEQQPTDRATDRPTDRPTLESVESVAARLGITRNAVLQRIKRGTLVGDKVDGVWWVRVDGDRPTEQPTDRPRRATPAGDQLTATDQGAAQLAILRDTLLAPLIALTERQQATIAEQAETIGELRARVASLEAKPAAQVMGELATRPAFVPITAPSPSVDTTALESERDALQARVAALEAENAAAATAEQHAPQRGQKRAWWRFWQP